jgi:hypothetical protein
MWKFSELVQLSYTLKCVKPQKAMNKERGSKEATVWNQVTTILRINRLHHKEVLTI